MHHGKTEQSMICVFQTRKLLVQLHLSENLANLQTLYICEKKGKSYYFLQKVFQLVFFFFFFLTWYSKTSFQILKQCVDWLKRKKWDLGNWHFCHSFLDSNTRNMFYFLKETSFCTTYMFWVSSFSILLAHFWETWGKIVCIKWPNISRNCGP